MTTARPSGRQFPADFLWGSSTAPPTWYEAVAEPQRKSAGNWRPEGRAVVIGQSFVVGHGVTGAGFGTAVRIESIRYTARAEPARVRPGPSDGTRRARRVRQTAN